jgi:hypothetical protein
MFLPHKQNIAGRYRKLHSLMTNFTNFNSSPHNVRIHYATQKIVGQKTPGEKFELLNFNTKS